MSDHLHNKQIDFRFSTTDVFNTKISLSDYPDDYILLVFLRYSGCPWCNLAIHRLALENSRLKAEGCQIIAFVQSDKDAIIDNIYNRHAPRPQFPIIADKKMKFYKQFGVESSITESLKVITKIPYWLEAVRDLGFKQENIDGDLFVVPAWFLINTKSNEIVKTERGVSFYNDETFTSIYESLTFKD